MNKRLITLQEAAQYLGFSYWSVRKFVLRGEMPFIRSRDRGRKYLLDMSDIDKWIDRNKRKHEY